MGLFVQRIVQRYQHLHCWGCAHDLQQMEVVFDMVAVASKDKGLYA